MDENSSDDNSKIGIGPPKYSDDYEGEDKTSAESQNKVQNPF